MLVNVKVAELSSLFSCVKRSAKIYLRNLGWQNLRVRSEGDTARIKQDLRNWHIGRVL